MLPVLRRQLSSSSNLAELGLKRSGACAHRISAYLRVTAVVALRSALVPLRRLCLAAVRGIGELQPRRSGQWEPSPLAFVRLSLVCLAVCLSFCLPACLPVYHNLLSEFCKQVPQQCQLCDTNRILLSCYQSEVRWFTSALQSDSELFDCNLLDALSHLSERSPKEEIVVINHALTSPHTIHGPTLAPQHSARDADGENAVTSFCESNQLCANDQDFAFSAMYTPCTCPSITSALQSENFHVNRTTQVNLISRCSIINFGPSWHEPASATQDGPRLNTEEDLMHKVIPADDCSLAAFSIPYLSLPAFTSALQSEVDNNGQTCSFMPSVARQIVLCHACANVLKQVGGFSGLSLSGKGLGPIPPPGGPMLVKGPPPVARRICSDHVHTNSLEQVVGFNGLPFLSKGLGPNPSPGGPMLVKGLPSVARWTKWRVQGC